MCPVKTQFRSCILWKYFFRTHCFGLLGCLRLAHCQSAQKIAWPTLLNVCLTFLMPVIRGPSPNHWIEDVYQVSGGYLLVCFDGCSDFL
jgi:hypothetical protein